MVGPRRFEPDKLRDDDDQDCPPSCPPCPPPTPPCCDPNAAVNAGPNYAMPSGPFGPTGQVSGTSADIELYDLIDFQMPVGNTGIIFVAGLTGWRESDGTAQFIPGATAAAYRRAASTLAQMSLVAGPTFQFIRLSLNLSTAQAATLCGVTESEITDWEDGTTPVPPSGWQTIADAAAAADMRAGIIWTALPSVDLRPRKIRIYPDIPLPNQPVPPPNPCAPC